MVSRTSPGRSVAGILAVALAQASTVLATQGLWDVDIDNGPAPPPSQRPPFSRGATYDPSLLKYQIAGIAGGYVGFVLILAFALLTFGRRFRRDAQYSSTSLSMEMVKPLKRTLDPSPISPDSTANFWRWGRGTPSVNNKDSPEQPSIVSFDDEVIEKDKVQRQEEMERLYAAVMSENTKAPRAITVPSRDVEIPTIKSPTHIRRPSSSSKSFSQPQPPHLRDAPYNYDSSHSRPPNANASAEAIYSAQAPTRAEPVYQAQTRPMNPAFYAPPQQNTRLPQTSPPRQTLPISPRSGRDQPGPFSHSRQSSGGSTRSRTGRASIRNLQISSPMPVPAFPGPTDYGDGMDDRAPLSPHYIPSNPPRPPPPPTQSRPESRPQTPIEDDYDEEDGSDGYDEDPPYYSETRAISNQRANDSIIHAYSGEEGLERPRPPPREAPQRSVPNLTISPPQGSAQASTGSLPLRQQSRTPTQGSATNNTLPFRAFHPPTPVSPSKPPQPYQAFSPGPTKTTFLSPRRDRFLPGGMNPIGPGGVPNTAALLSAGLATPYSPYMPFSPMTPVTPHLTNRRERRARQREGGRTIATEEDKVQDEKDMWGDGWD